MSKLVRRIDLIPIVQPLKDKPGEVHFVPLISGGSLEKYFNSLYCKEFVASYVFPLTEMVCSYLRLTIIKCCIEIEPVCSLIVILEGRICTWWSPWYLNSVSLDAWMSCVLVYNNFPLECFSKWVYIWSFLNRQTGWN